MNNSREFVSFLLHSSNNTYHIANPDIAGILFSILIITDETDSLLKAIQESWNFFHHMISENLEKAAPPMNYLIPYHILRIVGSPCSGFISRFTMSNNLIFLFRILASKTPCTISGKS